MKSQDTRERLIGRRNYRNWLISDYSEGGHPRPNDSNKGKAT